MPNTTAGLLKQGMPNKKAKYLSHPSTVRAIELFDHVFRIPGYRVTPSDLVFLRRYSKYLLGKEIRYWFRESSKTVRAVYTITQLLMSNQLGGYTYNPLEVIPTQTDYLTQAEIIKVYNVLIEQYHQLTKNKLNPVPVEEFIPVILNNLASRLCMFNNIGEFRNVLSYIYSFISIYYGLDAIEVYVESPHN